MTTKELVEKLNSLKRAQTEYDLLENYTQEEQLEYFGRYTEKAYGLDVDPHRHYETSIMVFNVDGVGNIGVRLVTNMYSEMSSLDDIMWKLCYFEVEEIMKPTYIVKKS